MSRVFVYGRSLGIRHQFCRPRSLICSFTFPSADLSIMAAKRKSVVNNADEDGASPLKRRATRKRMSPATKLDEDEGPIKSSQKRKRAAPATPQNSKAQAIDLTEDSIPTKDKGKKAASVPTQKEKRLRRHRDKPVGSFTQRLERAQSQRMFVIERTPGGDIDCPEETIAMAGTTGNVYNVSINKIPSCTCPDNRKGNQCKHIVYVLHNVLKAPEHLQYQLALLSTELQEIFAAAPSPVASAKSSDESEGEGRGAKRRPIDGDCPICFTPFEPESEEIVYCKAACGNNIHADCFEQWAKSQAGKDVRCVYCRSVWQGDEEQVMRIVKAKVKSGDGRGALMNDEGYLNVGTELGLSAVRGKPFCPCIRVSDKLGYQ